MQPSDNDLDKLSKEAAEHFEPSGASPNWAEMELLLNKQLPLKKDPRRRIFIALLLLLLLTGGGYLYFINGNEHNEDQTTTKHIPAITDDSKIAPREVPALKSPVSPTKDQALSTNPANQISQQESINKNTSKNSHNFRIIKKGKSRLTILQGEIAQADGENIPGTISSEKPDKVAQQERRNEPSQLNPMKEIEEADEENPVVIETSPPALVEAKPLPDTSNISVAKDKTASIQKQRWEISLLYAPELTTVGWKNIDKPGSNYGVLVGYRLNPKLSIQTGLIKSRKNYTVDGEDFYYVYNPSSSYKFTKVDGYCTMYEIPLNIKYKFSSGKKFTVYGITGLSSYIMTKEFYTYRYHNSNYDWSAEYNSQTNYWLAVVNLGMGIDKPISKNFNVGVNPFVKIPLAGMGKGELKLQGAGINFLFSYKLPSAKR